MRQVRRPFVTAVAMLVLVLLVRGGQGAESPPAGTPQKLLEEGYRLLDSGRAHDAEAYFREILTKDPGSLDAHEGLVWTYVQQRKLEKAAREADGRRALAPADAAWREKWIEIIGQVPARRKEAISAARAFADERQHDLKARLLLAKILSWAGQGEEAIRLFDALIAQDPFNVEALSGRAALARWDGDFETARGFLERAVAAQPDNAKLRAELNDVTPQAARLRAAREYDVTPLVVFGMIGFCVLLGYVSPRVAGRTYGALVLYTAGLVGLAVLWAYLAPGR